MGKKVLDVKNLTIQYRTDLETVHAVNGISFSLEKGETLGLVGETGAGKTTTALGIMGLLPERTAVIPEGSIEFEGTDLLKLSEQEMQKVRGSQISMIFQDPMTALNPVLPVGKQIGEALFLFFLRLTQIQIALEPGFDEPLILELIDLLGADAFLASIVRSLLADLLKRRLVFGCNFRLLAREDLAGLGGELCLQRADGRLGLAKFGVIGIEIALRLFEAVILLFALIENPLDL